MMNAVLAGSGQLRGVLASRRAINPYVHYLVYDTFTGSNGTVLPSHTPEKGGPWVKVGSNDIEIQSNRAQGDNTPTSGTLAVASIAGVADCVIVGVLRVNAGTNPVSSLATRIVDFDNLISAHISDSGNTFTLFEIIATVANNRSSVAIAIAAATDYTVKVVIQGPLMTAFLNGANRIRYGALANTTSILHGLRMRADATFGSGLADNFSIQRLWFALVSTQTLWSGSGATDWLGRTVLVDNGGTWIVAYRQGSQHSLDTASVIHLRFSTDEGATWTAADTYPGGAAVTGAPFARHASNGVADPLLMLAPNGDLLLQVGEINAGGNASGAYQYRSTNDGLTWTDEGLIAASSELYGGNDYKVIGTEIYSLFWKDAGSNGVPLQTLLYKTANNGTTWTLVSAVTSITEKTNEAGLAWLGGNNLLVFLRDDDLAKTYTRASTDLGQTWGTLTDVSGTFGVLHRARFRAIGNRLYLYGRSYTATEQYTVVWHSDDLGVSWQGPYMLKPTTTVDCGYCDMLPRNNDNLYFLTYEGTTTATNVVEYILSVER